MAAKFKEMMDSEYVKKARGKGRKKEEDDEKEDVDSEEEEMAEHPMTPGKRHKMNSSEKKAIVLLIKAKAKGKGKKK